MEPLTNYSIKEAVRLWCSKQTTKVGDKYGHISVWNTSAVTNMSNLFYKCKMFNDDISGWDVSKVRDMDWMFCEADAFNQDIGGWDVSKVTYMNDMFRDAKAQGNWENG